MRLVSIERTFNKANSLMMRSQRTLRYVFCNGGGSGSLGGGSDGGGGSGGGAWHWRWSRYLLG